MAIPQGRMSTVPEEGAFLPPEHRQRFAMVSVERGPVAIEDTTQGLVYQDWEMTWEAGWLVVTADNTPVPIQILAATNVQFLNFTFDQSGRIVLTYVNTTSSYLYWFDTQLGQTVLTDLGVGAITPHISLDDKRVAENVVNDMLLWYLKDGVGNTYDLFMALQRERFQTEYSMATDVGAPIIAKVGMSDGLRVQLEFVNDY